VANADGDVVEIHTGRAVTPRLTDPRAAKLNAQHDPSRLAPVRREMEEYFAGARKVFTMNTAPQGSAFQKQVWALLRQIPLGETRTYGQLAAELGVPNAARAVGRANATNPISIVVPCHRVVGASGALTGYAGGLPIKKWLLEFEGAIPSTKQESLDGLH